MLIMPVLAIMLPDILEFLRDLEHLMILNILLIKHMRLDSELLLIWFIPMLLIMFLMVFICLMELIIALVTLEKEAIIANGILCSLIIQNTKLKDFYYQIQLGFWKSIILMGFDLMQLLLYCISIMGQELDFQEIIKSILVCKLIQMVLCI